MAIPTLLAILFSLILAITIYAFNKPARLSLSVKVNGTKPDSFTVEVFKIEVKSSISSTNAQFVKQHPAGLQFVPVNKQANLSCSVHEGWNATWNISIHGDILMATKLHLRTRLEQQYGFAFTKLASTSSTVSFGNFDVTGNQTNNGTVITCIARQGISSQVNGNEVQVIFYGTPPPPTVCNIVTKDELGSLNISWSLGFIEGVSVNYTLTVLNLNTTCAQPIIIAGLLDQYYVFETSRPCDVYSFTVTAVTAAGNSTPSQEIIFARHDNNDMCPGTATAAATTTSENSGIGGGEIAGIGIGIGVLSAIVITAITVTLGIVISKDVLTADFSSLNNAKPCQETKVILTNASNSKIHIQYFLQLSRNSSIVENKPKSIEPSQKSYIVVTPQEKGRYILEVKAKERHIKGSPFHFEVELPIEEYSLECPRGLTTFQGEVLVVEKGKRRIYAPCSKKSKCDVDEDDLTEITVHEKTGNIFVTTGRHGRVLKLKQDDKVQKSDDKVQKSDDKVQKSDEKNKMKLANGLCINKDNKLYVCDEEACQIEVFNLDLIHIDTIVGGKKPFNKPHDIAFDNDNNMYIADEDGIQFRSPDGAFQKMIGEKELYKVRGLKIVNDSIFVASGEGVSLYSTDGTLIRHFFESGTYYDSRGITVDRDGYVYVSSGEGKVIKL